MRTSVAASIRLIGWTHSEETRLHSSMAYGQWLIARDSKCTPLKSLQGKIWQQGFASGELHGEVFPDVPIAFERWRRQKKIICIYSSGSVLAQQLLFRTTIYGDLTSYMSVFLRHPCGTQNREGQATRKSPLRFRTTPRSSCSSLTRPKKSKPHSPWECKRLLCVRARESIPDADVAGVIHDFDGVFSE